MPDAGTRQEPTPSGRPGYICLHAHPSTGPVKPTAKSPPPDKEEGNSPHVLVVDDEPAVRRFAARALEGEGYQVHTAKDGVEALELVGALHRWLGLIVTDIVMPRLDGVGLLQTLSASHPALPVILMSGHATEHLINLGLAVPCAVLGKPFSVEALVGQVRRCLEARP
jgi:two-component system, cell cycle sensor histidine kinase and response regulator CckA